MELHIDGCHKSARHGIGTALARFIIIGSLFLLLACQDNSGVGNNKGGGLSQARVVMTITPGKPSAPTESIELIKQDSNYILRLRRINATGELLEDEEVKLERQDFELVWAIVNRGGLRSFSPQEVDPSVIDFRERRLRVEFLGKEDTDLTVHDVVWSQPLSNETSIAPLISQLAQLARYHMKASQLFYFPEE